ncbi:MAG TPA: twin-arginine translocase TatA/TatE family subunit [Beijerinckiaceae bacterium]|nr:twin-arginine translocase TatA/TatE family subunit [Beijerinckiaceae bacterium]
MGGFSIWHWLIVGAIVLIVFGGKGKVSDLMGDVAKGIKSFKKGMQEDDDEVVAKKPAEPPRTIDHAPPNLAPDASQEIRQENRKVG